jgi:hypothetical protein
MDSAGKIRTARFQEWLQKHPSLTLGPIADHWDRSIKTVDMRRTGRIWGIPELTLRYLEQPGTRAALVARARCR